MKKKLLNKNVLFAFICSLGMTLTYAQADIEYTFDGTTWEGFTAQAGTGAFVSVFANGNPNDALNVSWPNTGAATKNVIMYAPAALQTMNADDRKFMQVKISNTSSEIEVMRIRGRVVGGSFINFIDIPITQDASGAFSTYDFEITNANYAGQLDKFQIVFRNSVNAFVLSANANTDAILVDNVLVSAATTLSVEKNNAFEFEMYPNPVKDKLYIKALEPIQKIEALDLLGRTVLTVNEVSDYVDVSSLTNAMYVIKITSDKGVATRKFIKE